jgi:hypothetical protein
MCLARLGVGVQRRRAIEDPQPRTADQVERDEEIFDPVVEIRKRQHYFPKLLRLSTELMFFQGAHLLNADLGLAREASHFETEYITSARFRGYRHLLQFIERHVKREAVMIGVACPLEGSFEGVFTDYFKAGSPRRCAQLIQRTSLAKQSKIPHLLCCGLRVFDGN